MKFTLKQKFSYWFDTQMARGSGALIKLLAVFTVLVIGIITALAFAFGYNAEEYGVDVFWDSFATVINAWMPYYEDGEGSIGYLIIMTIAALVGLLITSVLIGIVSTAIEEHIEGLKEGKSIVLEKDHIVILGFVPGEYTLIRQVILAAENTKRCIVIGADMKCEEMKELIYENVDVPKNVRLIFRTIDIFDPASIEKCSLQTCRNILITPMNDKDTVKALLAVSLIINSTDNEKVRVGALVSRNEYEFPETAAQRHNVTTIQIHHVITRMIAHSCTQTGLSDTFREIFAFEGNEFYVISNPCPEGITFKELTYKMDGAVLMGILRDGKSILNPEGDFEIRTDDRLIVFAKNRDAARIVNTDYREMPMALYKEDEDSRKVAIIGYNPSFELLLKELPENIDEVVSAGVDRNFESEVQRIGHSCEGRTFSVYDKDIRNDENLLELAKQVNHFVLLRDYETDEEDADLKTIFLIMKLRDLRTRYSLEFNITAEMCKKSNQNLISGDEHIDYVVASNMSSLFLAQLSENYEIVDVFKEILARRGNEFYLKKAGNFGCNGEYTTLQLRNMALLNKYIFIGYMSAHSFESHFNPGLEEKNVIDPEDYLIVLGES